MSRVCIAVGCDQVIKDHQLRDVPMSFDGEPHRYFVCVKHSCQWRHIGFLRSDNNPIRWIRCSCDNCKEIRRSHYNLCAKCGRLPVEWMYLGLLKLRGRISRDILGLLIEHTNAVVKPYKCQYCGEKFEEAKAKAKGKSKEAKADENWFCVIC